MAPDARSLAEVDPLLLLGLLVAQAEASRPEIVAKLADVRAAAAAAILGNDELAELDREQLRMLHGLLEA